MKINGLKLSDALIQFGMQLAPESPLRHPQWLMDRMSEQSINLVFVTLGRCSSGNSIFSWCVAPPDGERVNRILNEDVGSYAFCNRIEPVGSLTLFPHRSNLRLLGVLLSVCGRRGIPIHGLASSISTLTMTTDFTRLYEAVRGLQGHLELPAHHTPFDGVLRVKQTSRAASAKR